MRFTEIDGRRYEVENCLDCPFCDQGDEGCGAHCNHPVAVERFVELELCWIYYNYKEVPYHPKCPLREVQE